MTLLFKLNTYKEEFLVVIIWAQVQLVQYDPNVLDESILWTEKNLGDGYHAVRMVNNIRLNIDAQNGDRHHGGIHDGTVVILEGWKKGDNQRWRIDLHCK